MKDTLVSNRHFFKNVGKPAREPLMTVDELAAEFGLTRMALVALLAHRDGPKPAIKSKNSRSYSRTYYSPKEVRAWWATVSQ